MTTLNYHHIKLVRWLDFSACGGWWGEPLPPDDAWLIYMYLSVAQMWLDVLSGALWADEGELRIGDILFAKTEGQPIVGILTYYQRTNCLLTACSICDTIYTLFTFNIYVYRNRKYASTGSSPATRCMSRMFSLDCFGCQWNINFINCCYKIIFP